MNRYLRSWFAAAVFVLGVAVPLYSQATFGTITGIVRDTTGAVVPGASVKITNQATGIVRTSTTDFSGNYEVTHLNPGLYRVETEAVSFKSFVNKDVDLRALQTIRLDISLELGDVRTQVTVTAAVPVVETDVSSISATQTARYYRDLPLRTTSTVGSSGTSGVFNYMTIIPSGYQTAAAGFSVGGTTGSENYMNVDGISSNSTQTGGPAGTLEPVMDAIQDVRVDIVNNKAEFGKVVNVTTITKSGGNDFHGDLFWFNSNDTLNARNLFSPTAVNNIHNNYGWSIGGPIKRNKLFFFVSYEGERDHLPISIASNQPTLKMRQGDFSELLNLATPVAVRDPLSGVPFTGNLIPGTRLYQGSVNWQNRFFPAPNYGPVGSFVSNFRGSYPQYIKQDLFDVRTDYAPSARHSLYSHVMYKRFDPRILDGDLPPSIVGLRTEVRTGRQAMVSDTWTFNPHAINEFKAGFARDYIPRRGALHGTQLIALLGVQGAPSQDPDSWHIPAVAINGFSQVAEPGDQAPTSNIFQFIDQVTLIRGAHTVKTGGEFAPQQFNNLDQPTFGTYTFTNRFSGYAYSDFMLGLPQTTASAAPALPQAGRFWTLSGFVQDDWKVSSKLTLNYGLRYDYDRPPVDKYDNFANFDASTGSLVIASATARQHIAPAFPTGIPIITAAAAGFPGRALRGDDRNNFQPRIGFAYRPWSDNRTAVRGGYGIFNVDLTTASLSGLYGSPFSVSQSFTNSITNGVPLLTLNQPFLPAGTLGAINLTAMSVNVRNPYVQQWNFTIERDLGLRTALKVYYIGTKSTKLLYQDNINQPLPSTIPFSVSRRPFPNFNNVNMIKNGADQEYNALSVEANRKMANGLTFLSAWTYAKNLTEVADSGVSETNNVIENAYNRAAERGNASFNPRQRWVTNFVWELPVGRGKRYRSGRNRLGIILDDWQLSGTFVASTGEWLTPQFSGSDPSHTNTLGGRPDRIANGNLPPNQRTILHWFDASAFTAPANGRFGNAGRGIIEGPGRQVLNLGAYKNLHVTERTTLRLQATFTNALNHPNFANPAVNISAPGTVGTTSSVQANDMAGPRSGWIGIRLDF